MFQLQRGRQFRGEGAIASGQGYAGVFGLILVSEVGNGDEQRGIFRRCAPIRRSVAIPPLFEFGCVVLQIIGERLRVEMLGIFFGIKF